MSPAYDWRQLAELNRPQSAADMTAAIVDLRAQGLKAHDIADSLKLDLPTVLLTLARLGL